MAERDPRYFKVYQDGDDRDLEKKIQQIVESGAAPGIDTVAREGVEEIQRMIENGEIGGGGGGSGIDPKAREDIQKVTMQLTDTTQKTSRVGIHDSNLISRKSGSRKPMWTLIDDDGRTDFLTKWLPIMREKSIPISIGVITGSVGTNGYMSWEQLKQCENNGAELLSHTHTHQSLITLTEAQLRDDFETTTQILRENGMYNNFLVYPYNTHNESVRDIVREYFRAGISSDGQTINVPPVRSYRLSRIEFGKNDLAYYKSKIDECVSKNGWLISMTHSQYTDLDNTQLGYIKEAIDYAKSQGVEIATFSKAYSQYANLMESGIDTSNSYSVIDADGVSHGLRWNQYEKQFTIPSWFTGNNPYTDFPKNKVTVFDINSNQAGTWNMPEKTGGSLTMYYGTGSYYHYQMYKIINKDVIYTRHWDTANSQWSAWGKVGGEGSGGGGATQDFVKDSTDTIRADVLFNNLPTNYKTKYVVTRVNGSNSAGFPENKGGVLITNGCFGGWYAYQEYHPLYANSIYKRYVVNNDTWSEWTKIS